VLWCPGRSWAGDTEAGLAYVKTQAGQVSFTQPADLRRQLAAVAPGTAVTITYTGQQNGRKMVEVITA
jgi:hypothetical protein